MRLLLLTMTGLSALMYFHQLCIWSELELINRKLDEESYREGKQGDKNVKDAKDGEERK